MQSNDRLSAALKFADKPKKKRDKSTYYFANRKNAKAARDKQSKMNGRKIATATMRIQTDAIALAKSAWTDRNERVTESSSAIREAAKKRLGM